MNASRTLTHRFFAGLLAVFALLTLAGCGGGQGGVAGIGGGEASKWKAGVEAGTLDCSLLKHEDIWGKSTKNRQLRQDAPSQCLLEFLRLPIGSGDKDTFQVTIGNPQGYPTWDSQPAGKWSSVYSQAKINGVEAGQVSRQLQLPSGMTLECYTQIVRSEDAQKQADALCERVRDWTVGK